MQTVTNKLRYTVHSTTYGDREVTPMGETKLTIKRTLQNEDDDPIYDYLTTVEGTLVLSGDDFHYLLEIENDIAHRGDELLIELVDTKTGDTLSSDTKLILNNGTWDLDKCTVSIPITTPDKYEKYNEKKGDELNMFDYSGIGLQTVKPLDYVPTFEFNSSTYFPGAPGVFTPFPFASQNFEYFPTNRAQYPDFGPEGEQKPDYYPSSAVSLWDDVEMLQPTKNPFLGFEEVNAGSTPYHDAYPIPPISGFAAIVEGWRLYAFKYDFISELTGMSYVAEFKWCREIKDVAIGTVMSAEWFYVGVVGGMDRWARPPVLIPRTNVYKPSFKDPGLAGGNRITIIQTTFIMGGVTSLVDFREDHEHLNVYAFNEIDNGLRLNDIIEYTVQNIDPTLTVKSDFFQINPFTVSAIDYMTGLTSFVNEIIMYQKSDIKRPLATEHAKIGTYTGEELLLWILKAFKVKFRIDGNYFVMEHYTAPYFRRVATVDLTAPPNNKFTNGLRIYSYDKAVKIPAKETFKWMESRPQGIFYDLDDFNGVPILYDGTNVDRTKDNGVKAYEMGRITTDILYVLIHGGGIGYIIDNATKNSYPVQNAADDQTISDDGFCWIASKIVGGDRYIITEDIILGDRELFNNVLGWAYLHTSYFKNDGNAPTGTINNLPIVFDGTKYVKQSVDLPVNFCDITAFDPFEEVISDLGTGIVKTAIYNIFGSILVYKLGYQEV